MSHVDRPTELFRTPVGIAVGLLSLALLVYGLIALGNILLSVFAAILLVGGYVLLHVLLRLVTVVERVAATYERSVDPVDPTGPSVPGETPDGTDSGE